MILAGVVDRKWLDRYVWTFVPYKSTAVMGRDSLIVMNITARIPIHNQATAHSPCLSNGSNGSFNTTNISGKYETESTEAMNPTTSLWSLFQCRNINPFKFTLLLHFNYGFRSLSPEKHSFPRALSYTFQALVRKI